jgi:hypothetical protein
MYQSTTPCPRCGAQNLRGQWICAHCGNTLLSYCPNCHNGNDPVSQSCHACGAPLHSTQYGTQQQTYQSQDYSAPPSVPYQQAYPQYPPTGYQDQPPYGQYQQYPDGFTQYHDYLQHPSHGGGTPPQGTFDSLLDRVRQFVTNTNPVLLSALVVLVVGMSVFLVLAFQFGWIKTGAPKKVATVTDKTPPQISMLRIREGEGRGAIISWVTDEYSSSQVEYGVWPYANTTTPIQNDPTTGVNTGVLVHDVGITNLLPKTSYSYRAVSIDKYGNKGKSPDMQFDTTP